MLKLRRPCGVLPPKAGQLITREDVGRRELALWRMFYDLPAQPSRCHHAAGEVRVLAKSLTSTPDQRPGCCPSRRGTFSHAELTGERVITVRYPVLRSSKLAI